MSSVAVALAALLKGRGEACGEIGEEPSMVEWLFAPPTCKVLWLVG